jgi:uncharacterized glyoxalase superfamily protein PhnB
MAAARPVVIPSVTYKDARAALDWLERAFGFEPAGVFTDSEGNIVHAEMSFGDAIIMVGGEWQDWARSPASMNGVNTQRVHVRLERDIDGHCARARAAGATIASEPSDQFYGDRTYAALDLEGHRWTFAKAVRDVSVGDMEKASGLAFKEKL